MQVFFADFVHKKINFTYQTEYVSIHIFFDVR